MFDFKQHEREPEGIIGLLLQHELSTYYVSAGMKTAFWGRWKGRKQGGGSGKFWGLSGTSALVRVS